MKAKITILSLMVTALFCSAAAAQEQQQKPVAVVVPFDSSGVPQEEVDVLDRMFLSEFARTGKCTVVDRSSFDKIRAQQKFQLSDWSNNDKVAKLGKALNANVVVTGQVMRFRSQVMFVTQILDVNTTEILSSSDKAVNDVAELFGIFSAMCRTLTSKLPEPPVMIGKYKVGDKGPGGGYVFYYLEEGFPVTVDGKKEIFHYLECSPMKLGDIRWCPCSSPYCNITTIDGVGVGKDNTARIIGASHPGGKVTASNCAAYACNEYFTGTTKAGEWYLPSKIELNLIYENLVKTRVIKSSAWHWSSSQVSYDYTWYQRFSDGYQDCGSYYRKDRFAVRAVRAF
ncbi:MAG: hypothetical protein K2N31_02135 [Treponemataceae bacterium]|nr:hypothetical protein [Treponemataceae bacterium]